VECGKYLPSSTRRLAWLGVPRRNQLGGSRCACAARTATGRARRVRPRRQWRPALPTIRNRRSRNKARLVCETASTRVRRVFSFGETKPPQVAPRRAQKAARFVPCSGKGSTQRQVRGLLMWCCCCERKVSVLYWACIGRCMDKQSE
jgi:hypothetical protein